NGRDGTRVDIWNAMRPARRHMPNGEGAVGPRGGVVGRARRFMDGDAGGARHWTGAVHHGAADAAGRHALRVHAAGGEGPAEQKHSHCKPPKNWHSSIHVVVSVTMMKKQVEGGMRDEKRVLSVRTVFCRALQ